ncbi:MAG TPA: hypothetical protein VJR89_07290 [Polyangiales bacterium]|nr:hypothetical protein [Polyangiales bacterium]
MLGAHGGELVVPALSALAAAAALTWALLATHPEASLQLARSPERAAEDFARAYQARDFAAAADLASGSLRRSLEVRARSARLQGKRSRREAAGQLVIEECFMLAERKLRFLGVLAERDEPGARGWPISITVGQHGDNYLAEALSWPQGPPPDER